MLDKDKHICSFTDCNLYSFLKIGAYPDSTIGGGKAGSISEPTLYLLGEIVESRGIGKHP
jgi:hypothetical protein